MVKERSEADLLSKINRGAPPEKQKRYRELIAKRQGGTLTPEEHQELLELGDEMERLEAKRLKYLSQLAEIRGVSLTQLVTELGIRPTQGHCSSIARV
ncbi:MAG: hypothetical protein GXP42_18165 [Chloroflexi bacterium]|nr:hypothetical protein [Chloroflexota bacterium]